VSLVSQYCQCVLSVTVLSVCP